jgi:hypothetical protein
MTITRIWRGWTRAEDGDEVPVLEPPALALLSRHDDRAVHYDGAKK